MAIRLLWPTRSRKSFSPVTAAGTAAIVPTARARSAAAPRASSPLNTEPPSSSSAVVQAPTGTSVSWGVQRRSQPHPVEKITDRGRADRPPDQRLEAFGERVGPALGGREAAGKRQRHSGAPLSGGRIAIPLTSTATSPTSEPRSSPPIPKSRPGPCSVKTRPPTPRSGSTARSAR
jgi:hypothetical protein